MVQMQDFIDSRYPLCYWSLYVCADESLMLMMEDTDYDNWGAKCFEELGIGIAVHYYNQGATL